MYNFELILNFDTLLILLKGSTNEGFSEKKLSIRWACQNVRLRLLLCVLVYFLHCL